MIAIGAVIPKRTRARYSPAPPGVPAREEASDGDRHRRSPLRAHGPAGDAHAQPPRPADRARFGTAFAKVGFGGDYGTTWNLTRRVGPAKAKELFFLADLVSAEEAAQLGLVNRVFPHDAFVDEVGRIAARIAHGPLVSYRYMKENVNLSLTADFRTVLDREAVTHLRCGQTADHREGVAAFLEKREPRFQGR